MLIGGSRLSPPAYPTWQGVFTFPSHTTKGPRSSPTIWGLHLSRCPICSWRLSAKISADLHKKLKTYAASHDKTVKVLVEEFIRGLD